MLNKKTPPPPPTKQRRKTPTNNKGSRKGLQLLKVGGGWGGFCIKGWWVKRLKKAVGEGGIFDVVALPSRLFACLHPSRLHKVMGFCCRFTPSAPSPLLPFDFNLVKWESLGMNASRCLRLNLHLRENCWCSLKSCARGFKKRRKVS